MSVGFLACGCGFYGLNYSAGQLSPSVYVSTSLLHGGDIVGYTLALSADKYGRNLVQARSSGSFADFLQTFLQGGLPFSVVKNRNLY